MATNNFKAFALDPNANVISQADWEALPALLSGFTSGKASSAQVNKAIRQATTIGALIGQFIANSGVDALDNADVNGLVTKFINALNKTSQPLDATLTALAALATGANKLPYFTGIDTAAQTDLTAFARTLLSRSDAASIISDLGLGTAAQRNVGSTNGTNQIPDMNSFGAGTQWFKLPTGNIVQAWQATINGSDANGTTLNLPVAFPNSLYAANAIWLDPSSIAPISYKIIGFTKTTVTIKAGGSGSYGSQIIAIGI